MECELGDHIAIMFYDAYTRIVELKGGIIEHNAAKKIFTAWPAPLGELTI